MSNLRSLAGLTATVAIALVGWSCEARNTALAPSTGGPSFHFNEFECVPLKMTGGGRIDFPPGTQEKNPPASHLYETFGAHVMASGRVDENGVCLADKGQLQWVDHRPEMRINGSPLNLHSTAITFARRATDVAEFCVDGAVHWGGLLRVNNTDQENIQFEVWDCDNGEPGRRDGFAIRVWDPIDGVGLYEVMCNEPEINTPSEPTCFMTGGNRQFHPTH